MWSIDYVQVPDEQIINSKILSETSRTNSPKHAKPNNEAFCTSMTTSRHLKKQSHVFNDEMKMSSLKSGSESSLTEDNLKAFSNRQRSDDYSSKEWISEQQDEKETCSDTEECTPPVPPARRRKSRVQIGLRKSEG